MPSRWTSSGIFEPTKMICFYNESKFWIKFIELKEHSFIFHNYTLLNTPQYLCTTLYVLYDKKGAEGSKLWSRVSASAKI